MKKISSFLVLFIALLMLIPAQSSALTVNLLDFGDWTNSGILSERNDWTEVAEMENVYSDSRITGSNFSIYDPSPVDAGWGGVMWIWGAPGYAQTVFTTPSDSLFVQFESDSNDGLADFYIDGSLVYSLNTYNGSWFGVTFSDLAYQVHTLKVVAKSTSYPRDLAIDAMGSGAPGSAPPVPEPATMFLLGSGLFGLGVFRKKFGK